MNKLKSLHKLIVNLFFVIVFLFTVSCQDEITETNFSLTELGDRGNFTVTSNNNSQPIPLVIVLHGFMANAWAQSAYLNLGSLMKNKKFHLVYLNGAKNINGHRFWNASKACCNLFDETVNDYQFINSVINHLKSKLKVSKVYLFGHSNGGFMAYSFLCRHPESVDGIASLAGIESAPDCKDVFAQKKVLHIHGTNDPVITLKGGSYRGMLPYQSLTNMLESWKSRLSCKDVRVQSELNFSSFISGFDSRIHEYSCDRKNKLAYFEIVGGKHIPLINDELREHVFQFWEIE